jgi:hypothetical protein
MTQPVRVEHDGAFRLSNDPNAHGTLWRDGVYDQIQEMMPLQGSLSIERMCQLARVSRAGFYRSLQGHVRVQEDLEVRSTIQAIGPDVVKRSALPQHLGGGGMP